MPRAPKKTRLLTAQSLGMAQSRRKQQGKLAIPLPFEDAIRAVLEVKPRPKPPKKKPQPKGKKAG